MMNVTIDDNGSAYMISVDGLIVTHKPSLGDAWRHVEWMYRVATQKFLVGAARMPVEQWIREMKEVGYLD